VIFATNADIEAENAMLAVLRHERPSDAILGEESGRTEAADNGRTWLIDPLCGTLNYAARVTRNLWRRSGRGSSRLRLLAICEAARCVVTDLHGTVASKFEGTDCGRRREDAQHSANSDQ
jgi:hypothetical protein